MMPHWLRCASLLRPVQIHGERPVRWVVSRSVLRRLVSRQVESVVPTSQLPARHLFYSRFTAANTF
jgi:hypothetical protein